MATITVFEKLEEELQKKIAKHDKLIEGVPCSGANELLWEIKGFSKALQIVRIDKLGELMKECSKLSELGRS